MAEAHDLYNIQTAEGTFAVGGKIADGEVIWRSNGGTSLGSVTLAASTSGNATGTEVTLSSSVMPDDGYDYLIYVRVDCTSTASTSGTTATTQVSTSLTNNNQVQMCASVARSASKAQTSGCGWIPIGANRKLKIYNSYGAACTVAYFVYAYRRIGTNPSNPTTAGCVQRVTVPTADGLTHDNCNVSIYRSVNYDATSQSLSFPSADYAEIPHGKYTDATYQVEFTTGSTIPTSSATTVQTIVHSENWVSLDLTYDSTNGTAVTAYNWTTPGKVVAIPNSDIAAYTTYQVQYEAHDTSAKVRYCKWPDLDTSTYGGLSSSPVIYATTIIQACRNYWYSGSGFIGISGDGYVVLFSRNTSSGIDYQTQLGSLPSSGDYWRALAYDNNKYIVISTQGYVSYSTDGGSSWSTPVKYLSVSSSTASWVSCIYSTSVSKFIALDVYGKLAYSADGLSWVLCNAQLPSKEFGDGYRMLQCVDSTTYVAVAEDGSVYKIKGDLSNTTTTKTVTQISSLNTSYRWQTINYTSKGFQACADGGYITKSIELDSDGCPIKWQSCSRFSDAILSTSAYWYSALSDGSDDSVIYVGFNLKTITGTLNKTAILTVIVDMDNTSWSSWTSWNDTSRSLSASYPMRLGQQSYKDYEAMASLSFKGTINLDGCYIAPTENMYAWKPDLSTVSGSAIVTSIMQYCNNLKLVYSQSLFITTPLELYFINGSNSLTVGSYTVTAHIDSSEQINNGIKVSISVYNDITGTDLGTFIAYRDSSKDASPSVPYWTGTGGKSSEIFDLALNDTMDYNWRGKAVNIDTVSLTNNQYSYALTNYLPNDGNQYEILTSCNWNTAATNNAYCYLSINSYIVGGVKTYAAASAPKCRTFITNPLKSTDSIVYKIASGSSNGSLYIKLLGYRKIGTMGNSLTNKFYQIQTRDETGSTVTRQIGGWRLPGQWVASWLQIAQNLTVNSSNSSKNISVSLANYLPVDNQQYEVIVGIESHTKAESGSYIEVRMNSGVENCRVSGAIARSAAVQVSRDTAIIPINGSHTLNMNYYISPTTTTANVWVYLVAYRRIGDLWC